MLPVTIPKENTAQTLSYIIYILNYGFYRTHIADNKAFNVNV